MRCSETRAAAAPWRVRRPAPRRRRRRRARADERAWRSPSSAGAGEAELLAGPKAELAVAARARLEAQFLLVREGALEPFLALSQTVHVVLLRRRYGHEFASLSRRPRFGGRGVRRARRARRASAPRRSRPLSAEPAEISKMPFEAAMAELEGIVDRLEKGERDAGGIDPALRARRSPEGALRGVC